MNPLLERAVECDRQLPLQKILPPTMLLLDAGSEVSRRPSSPLSMGRELQRVRTEQQKSAMVFEEIHSLVEALKADNLDRIEQLSLLLDLRDAQKQACHLVRDRKEVLSRAKSGAEKRHLDLQNLNYEILHLEKEIVKCRQFE